MRILFCSPTPVTDQLGAPKVYLEIAAALNRLGWDTKLVGLNEWGAGAATPRDRAVQLRSYLREYAAEYDIVEYEHTELPFPRAQFPASTLFVARSVLLVHHLLAIEVPPRPGLRRVVGKWLFGRSRRRQIERQVQAATETCREADVVNVSNSDDRAELISHSVPVERILVLPYAVSVARRSALGACKLDPPSRPCVAFVGTFDPRKGMRDFPSIVATVAAAIPDVRFKLLGTAGMLQTAAEVITEFPRGLRSRIEVVPRYQSEALPALLADCSAGVFPSAVEGFPFGVLEMLAAGLPVVAYRVPGPPEMLSAEYLVARGDTVGMAQKITALLGDFDRLRAARLWARSRAADFCWDDVARKTADEYTRRLQERRENLDRGFGRPIGGK